VAIDYPIERVRSEWIGKIVQRSRGRFPVEHDPIRRWCHMVGDTNPLYLDPEYAATGPYGAVIVPPPLTPFFAGNGPWPRRAAAEDGYKRAPGFTSGVPTPGDRGINMGIRWQYLLPVRVGDRLESERTVSDVFVKPIRLDPLTVWIVTETRISNQRNELVAVGHNTVLVHRSPVQIASEETSEAVH
jgi:acyl dehydratase